MVEERPTTDGEVEDVKAGAGLGTPPMVNINAADQRVVPGLRLIALAVAETDEQFSREVLMGLRWMHPKLMADLEAADA